MLARMLLCLVLSGDQCPDCRVNGTAVVACQAHAKEERLVLQAERLHFQHARNDTERIAALEAIARITHTRENAPSPEVPKALAIGLSSASLDVRARSIELLAPPQHAGTTVEVLLGALKEWNKEAMKVLGDAIAKADLKTDVTKLTAKELGVLADRAGAAAEIARKAAKIQRLQRMLLVHLTTLPDDRVVDALVEFGSLFDSALQTVLPEIRRTLLVMLVELEGWECSAESVAARVEELRNETIPDPPASWNDTEASWHEKQEALRQERVQTAEKTLNQQRGSCALLLARMRELTAKDGLEPVPAEESEQPKAWRNWFKMHGAVLPEDILKVLQEAVGG